MNSLKISLIIILVTIFSSFTFANDLILENSTEWQLSESENNIKVFTLDIKQSNFEAFKAVATLNTSIESIFAVIADPSSCPLWVDNCLESYSITSENPGENDFNNHFGYALNHLPWPFKDRDLIVKITISNDPNTKEIRITMRSHEQKASKNKKAVHIINSETQYILRPLQQEKTELVWIQHTDPNGTLPAWLVNSMIISLPLKSIQALEKTANLEKYQNAIIEYDSQNHIQGLKFDTSTH